MTKVKTILAEFCSAKDLLAMNRIGLLKREERESQPIPWRHRLNNTERRELVKAEMRMSLKPTASSRVISRDKVKAVTEAKSPKDSKMGETLLNIHVRGDPSLQKHLKRINNEQHRQKQGHQQTQHLFLRRSQCLNHEPLILVERPASPNVRTRALLMKQHGVDPQAVRLPSYMRPLQSRSRTPSTLTTIDAFSVASKKKKNVWEEAMEEKDDLKFKSAARPVTRLTDFEKQQLKIGHALHKPTQESVAAQTKADTNSKKSRRRRRPGSAGSSDEDSEDSDASTPRVHPHPPDSTPFFITESEPISHSSRPKPAFISIAASAGLEAGFISNYKPRQLTFSFDGQGLHPGRARGKKAPGRAPLAMPRAHTVVGMYSSKTFHSNERPGSQPHGKPPSRGKTGSSLSSYGGSLQGKERGEQKTKKFLSVLLDEN